MFYARGISIFFRHFQKHALHIWFTSGFDRIEFDQAVFVHPIVPFSEGRTYTNFRLPCAGLVPNPEGRTYTNFWFVVRSAEISRISSGQGGALAIPE